MMKLSKKTLLYTAYVVGITAFFLYLLFPSDTVRLYLAHQLSQGNPDVTVNIDRVRPVLPPGIKLHDIDIAYRNMVLFNFDNLKIMPSLLSLFSSTTNLKFKGQVYNGSFNGRAELDDRNQNRSLKIDGKISGVQLREIESLQQMSAHKISGALGGDFVLADRGPNRSLTGKLVMSDCQVELEEAVFNQKSLAFKNVNAELMLNNNTLNIKQCNASGNQLDVSISGTILLNPNSGKNTLNLTGSLTPHHALLAKIEKSFPIDLLRKNKSGNSAISFKIDGTLDQPGFSLN
jgi:type II secretion system protein N